jgi:hypothetical protein
LQHERDVLCAGFADRFLRFAQGLGRVRGGVRSGNRMRKVTLWRLDAV